MCLENNYQIKTWTFQCSQCSRTDMHCSVCTLKGRIDESHVNMSQRGKHTLTLVHTASLPDPWRSEFQAWNSVEKLNECLCLQLQVSTSECNATIPLNSHIPWRSVHVSLLIKYGLFRLLFSAYLHINVQKGYRKEIFTVTETEESNRHKLWTISEEMSRFILRWQFILRIFQREMKI